MFGSLRVWGRVKLDAKQIQVEVCLYFNSWNVSSGALPGWKKLRRRIGRLPWRKRTWSRKWGTRSTKPKRRLTDSETSEKAPSVSWVGSSTQRRSWCRYQPSDPAAVSSCKSSVLLWDRCNVWSLACRCERLWSKPRRKCSRSAPCRKLCRSGCSSRTRWRFSTTTSKSRAPSSSCAWLKTR